MSHSDLDGNIFYRFAMNLFYSAGHVFTSSPEFINHSPKQFVYFDNRTDIALSLTQRELFQLFNNISRLFSINNCIFFSIDLLTTKSNRSQVAHDIHMMIHSITESKGTICLFRYNDEIMLSFTGFGCRCILSDWYLMEDDYERLLKKLDIANMSVSKDEDYFNDMIYSLARDYYLREQPTVYDLLPIDFISNAGIYDVDREEIDKHIEFELATLQRKYGDDYVEYDKSVCAKYEDINAEFDLVLLELDIEDSLEEKLEFENTELEEEFETNEKSEDKDIYELDNIDSEILQDPELLVKWLKKLNS